MSVHVSSAVWKQSESRGTARLVLLRLADQANDDGWCWPGLLSLAGDCRISVSSVGRATTELVRLGEITKGRRGEGRSNLYRVLIGTPADAEVTCQSDRSNPQVIRHEPSSDLSLVTNPKEPSKNHQKNAPRAPDLIFEALCNAIRLNPQAKRTRDESGRLNAAAKQLREIAAEPDEIRRRGQRWRARNPERRFWTAQAITANWGTLGEEAPNGPPVCQWSETPQGDYCTAHRAYAGDHDLTAGHDIPKLTGRR